MGYIKIATTNLEIVQRNHNHVTELCTTSSEEFKEQTKRKTPTDVGLFVLPKNATKYLYFSGYLQPT